MTQVAIIQRRLTHYRVPLFHALRDRLEAAGITLRVLHGEPTPIEAGKNDGGHLEWAERLTTRYFVGDRLCWQPFVARTRDCDLVIVTQENKLISNLRPLMSPARRSALAFWGHGRNLQANQPDSVAERFKRWTTRRADWYFAYTEQTRALVIADGFDPARVTVLNNAIDNESLARDLRSISDQECHQLLDRLAVGRDSAVGLYCGSLYPDKRLDLLIEAGDVIHRRVANFCLVIMGDGPSAGAVRQAAMHRPWLHPIGAKHGREKAAWFRIATVMLAPGAVGLQILDSFVSGVPLITTRDARHGPEIGYLESGVNGEMTDSNTKDFADVVTTMILDVGYRARLSAAAATASERYTLSAMVGRFATGIQDCLSNAPRRS